MPELVRVARQIEMSFFEKMHAYDRVPRRHQRETGGKVIGVRWVDANTGDAVKPDYRSRLVARNSPPTQMTRYMP